jgi:GNAT superfamily N-acetyltransferase
MSSFQLNPAGVDGEYLECLNTAFGKWGDRRQFDWYYRRDTTFPPADLLVFREHGKLAAGSGVTYRRVRLPDDEEMIVGIITGSWTLPEHRGKGLFSRLIERSRQQAERKGAKLLLAFVTADNFSREHMRKVGSLLFPSFYLVSTESTPQPKARSILEARQPDEKIIGEMFEKFIVSGKGAGRIAYPSASDFCAQFFERPHETEVLMSGNGDFAVVEKRDEMNLVQLFLPHDEKNFFPDLLAHTLSQNRKLFAFTMHEETAGRGRDLGLLIKKGFLTVLPISSTVHLPARLTWKIENGDRA